MVRTPLLELQALVASVPGCPGEDGSLVSFFLSPLPRLLLAGSGAVLRFSRHWLWGAPGRQVLERVALAFLSGRILLKLFSQ